MCMFLASAKDIPPESIMPTETNRYDSTSVGAVHQHFSNFLRYTGTTAKKPRYYRLVEGLEDAKALTLHGWTYNVIAFLKKQGFNSALIVEDDTNYSNSMAVHKVYTDLLRGRADDDKILEQGFYEIERAKERLSKVSDREDITDYAHRSFETITVNIHNLFTMSHLEINEISMHLTERPVTQAWYERLQQYAKTNYAIWEQINRDTL